MKLIADSGSTKTDWRLIDEYGNIHHAQTIGMNPFFTSAKLIAEALEDGAMKLFPKNEILEVHFYGSGLGSKKNHNFMNELLTATYSKADIFVEHDLLGAARAVCGKTAGLTAILGTGANTCFYDGNKISKNVPSLGYVLSDEGSGAHIGKTFVTECLLGNVPAELTQQLELNKDDVLEKVYQGDRPNRYLASFCTFLQKNIEHDYIKELIKNCFDQFCKRLTHGYQETKEFELNIVGSIAYYFKPLLEEMCTLNGIKLGQVIEKPIASLTLYHLSDQ